MKVQKSLFLVAIFYLAYTHMVKGLPQPRKDCQIECGNVKIEYPFGISSGCYYPGDDSFNLTCVGDKLYKRYIVRDIVEDKLYTRDIEVRKFNHSGHLQVLLNVSSSCNNQSIEKTAFSFKLGNLSLSADNKFTIVGCNALAFVSAYGSKNFSAGCISLCEDPPLENRGCNGVGCSTTDVSFPVDNTYTFGFVSTRITDLPYVHPFNPCTYAFLVQDNMFNFSATEDLRNLRNVKKFPVLLDWSIGNQTCEQAGGGNRTCGGNSTCSNSTTRSGFICSCNEGFDGNPYLLDGCQDINECTSNRHNCSDPKTCKNKVGGFDCKCPSGYRLDTTNMSCKRKEFEFGWVVILLATTIAFLVLLLVFGLVKHRLKIRKDTELRQQFFEQNGGGMLIQRLSGPGQSNTNVKIFTEKGMKEATNGYDENRILGQGGQGTVYKGILPENSIVAIKKARLGDNSQVEQFINEVLVLSQINHRNVVKLLGCCLETEVPLLVYEFITNGTLFDHLHGSILESSLTWECRLRIAIEVAGTLAYLHSSASIPIIHRDVKTANILLDENLTAKVADFGASRLIPMDKEDLATLVQGTIGYLDPEYYNTGLLNEKSDVYSFGVVLMELLSGQKAMCFERPQTSKHLVNYFASAMKENRLHEVIDGQVMKEDNQREIQEVASIALECTRIMGEERPRMTEVATKLEALRVTTTKHKWSDQCPEDNEHLIGGHIMSAQGDVSTTSTIGYDSIKNVAILDIESGR